MAHSAAAENSVTMNKLVLLASIRTHGIFAFVSDAMTYSGARTVLNVFTAHKKTIFLPGTCLCHKIKAQANTYLEM